MHRGLSSPVWRRRVRPSQSSGPSGLLHAGAGASLSLLSGQRHVSLHPFIHAGHQGAFQLLTPGNQAAVNMGVQTSIRGPAFSSWGRAQRWNGQTI